VVVLAALLISALATLALAVAGVLVPVDLPDVFRKRPSVRAKELADWKNTYAKPVYSEKQMRELAAKRKVELRRRARVVADAADTVLPLPEQATVAFVMRDDPAANASLERHIAQANVVVPDWFSVQGPSCELSEHIDAPTRRIVDSHDVMVLPRLTNVSSGDFGGGEMAKLLRSAPQRECLVEKIVKRLVELKADGLDVDIEALQPEDSEPFLELLVDLKNGLHKHGLRLAVNVSLVDAAYDVELIGKLADAVFVMAYDQHYPSSRPGPIAGTEWFAQAVTDAAARVPKDRLVMALGGYCYDWVVPAEQESAVAIVPQDLIDGGVADASGGALAPPPGTQDASGANEEAAPPVAAPGVPLDDVAAAALALAVPETATPPTPLAEGLSFREAMDRARTAGAVPEFEREAGNARFGYTDVSQRLHDVWCQDALSAWNQSSILADAGLSRIAVWRLGTEDETVWNFLGQAARPAPNVLEAIPASPAVDLVGEGEVLTIRAEPTKGRRSLELDEHKRVAWARYEQAPTGFVVERRGSPGKDLVLTFDDGPDPTWTRPILKALEQLRVPAVFFVVGDQVMQNPQLVRDMDEAGHLVANHTFSHPRLDRITPAETRVELNSTARLLEGLTGKRSPVFRAPYTANTDPSRPEDLNPLRVALQNGYLFVGANIDPLDWAKPGADVIARRMVEQAEKGGRIVLLHDGGGDRSQTVKALHIAVPELRKRGYRFVTLEQYMGLTTPELVESLGVKEQALAWGNLSVARARSWGWDVLSVLFFGCTILAIVRVVMLGILTLVQAKREVAPRPKDFSPLVTILVPAFNEGKVIERTVTSVLGTGYDNVEVLVIDDGSTDDTAEVVRALMAHEPRVRLLQKANGGKANASNAGLAEARGEIVVAVDADTIIMPEAIERLVAHFVDPKVTAVCGNVEVGNVNSWLTRFQAIEYVTSQNFDRRAFAILNSISVVPGALGAWRRAAVQAVGGYSHDTLTEDADLTLTVLRNGGRIAYEPRSFGRTEAPETVSALLKQRFRWTYGTYQCLFKHRKAFFRGTLGWFGLPNMVVFQVVFAALSPIGDLVMVLSLIRGDFSAFAAGYVAFLLMDVCGSILAFTLDEKPLRWLWMLLIQRFTYRQMMYYVSLKAMLAALQGARHGWRKLDRTGTVNAPKA
jgi:cellulose synthase/poly-beta-1,6-N-acetylglucosamine synthase-like glycosyltransferase/peptidoglycan/xylan/chitin deacetylase (PgdA/CDA1 family)/spore germination protein YaaH